MSYTPIKFYCNELIDPYKFESLPDNNHKDFNFISMIKYCNNIRTMYNGAEHLTRSIKSLRFFSICCGGNLLIRSRAQSNCCSVCKGEKKRLLSSEMQTVKIILRKNLASKYVIRNPWFPASDYIFGINLIFLSIWFFLWVFFSQFP